VSDTTPPPHVHPFRMIDVVLEYGRERCSTIRAVTSDEVVRDEAATVDGRHPFSLLLEAMAQAAVPLAGVADVDHPHASPAPPRTGMVVRIDEARLLATARPGDRLLITASITHRFGAMIRVRTLVEVAGSPPGQRVVAEGTFTIALGEPA
jgi:3-hydroxymyristoyl/3-hydroxydecanoyl-(acyl carrier protein) dehydratase